MRETVTDESIQGFGHLKKIFAAFRKLESVGTERDTAKNRTLHYSQYVSLILLSMFNPATMCARAVGCVGAEESAAADRWWASFDRIVVGIGPCVRSPVSGVHH